MSDIELRLQRCEGANRILSAIVVLSLLVVIGTLWRGLPTTTVQAQGRPAVITASELAIVDANGVVRVRIGTKLPDAVIKGKPKPRGDQAAGLILYDETGQERGGYVTFSPSGYVGLTVDSREQMVGSFMAGPTGGAMLQIGNGGLVQLRRDNDWVELRADESGPHMNTVRTRQLTSRTPTMSAEEVRFVCAKLKEELTEKAKLSAGQAVQACKERMSIADCQTCFGAVDR